MRTASFQKWRSMNCNLTICKFNHILNDSLTNKLTKIQNTNRSNISVYAHLRLDRMIRFVFKTTLNVQSALNIDRVDIFNFNFYLYYFEANKMFEKVIIPKQWHFTQKIVNEREAFPPKKNYIERMLKTMSHTPWFCSFQLELKLFKSENLPNIKVDFSCLFLHYMERS